MKQPIENWEKEFDTLLNNFIRERLASELAKERRRVVREIKSYSIDSNSEPLFKLGAEFMRNEVIELLAHPTEESKV